MNKFVNILSQFFNKQPVIVSTPVVAIKNPEPMLRVRDFSYHEAFYMHKPFQLRNGMPFKTLSLNYKRKNDPNSYVLIHVEGNELPTCYYADGIANELELSGYDLVMVD